MEYSPGPHCGYHRLQVDLHNVLNAFFSLMLLRPLVNSAETGIDISKLTTHNLGLMVEAVYIINQNSKVVW